MTDRELLELAAKASNIEDEFVHDGRPFLDRGPWNPLADDGDALRLAVELNFTIYHEENRHFVEYEDEANDMMVTMIEESDDALTATRLVIVHAAAELGKGMQ